MVRGASLTSIVAGVLAGVLFLPATAATLTDDPFPQPASLHSAVNFWIDIYSKYGTNRAVIHDSSDLSVVYDVFTLPENSRKASELVTERKEHFGLLLRRILLKNQQGLTIEEQQVLSKFAQPVSRARLEAAQRNIRFQLGQKDRFLAGVIRSGTYLDHIRTVLKEEGVPEDLAYLPHVESSFDLRAYSKYGAAGMWQFLRSTGRRYLRINAAVDERFDPFVASHAAARHLKREYELLGSWPLAVLAYNHGARGVRRAVEQVGSSDIDVIITRYEGRTFGFASKNFYPSFLAARHVAKNVHAYFGAVAVESPANVAPIRLREPMFLSHLANQLPLTEAELVAVNPALRAAVVKGYRKIPRNQTIYVPTELVAKASEIDYDAPEKRPIKNVQPVSDEQRELARLFTKEKSLRLLRVSGPTAWLKVDTDETLGHYATWANTSTAVLRELNGIRRSRDVRLGELIKVDLSNTTQEQFEQRRVKHHDTLQAEFFSTFQVRGVTPHRVVAGDNLWKLGREVYDVPSWLIQKYNLGTDWERLPAGTVINIPVVEERKAEIRTVLQ